ncbi:hypothetical protein [uncultured Clostridium sp.]|uniref:hypothetical protein n=1 Tax=uncultured Clostridium sp. TaxID=59620 RepID=UPI0025D206A5|nr:hypothetical protein [uncultured Clostridium sp.]
MKNSYYEAEAEIEAINIETISNRLVLKYDGVEYGDYIYLFDLICKDYNIKRNTTKSKLLRDKINHLKLED